MGRENRLNTLEEGMMKLQILILDKTLVYLVRIPSPMVEVP